jgi:hypothetical protein
LYSTQSADARKARFYKKLYKKHISRCKGTLNRSSKETQQAIDEAFDSNGYNYFYTQGQACPSFRDMGVYHKNSYIEKKI